MQAAHCDFLKRNSVDFCLLCLVFNVAENFHVLSIILCNLRGKRSKHRTYKIHAQIFKNKTCGHAINETFMKQVYTHAEDMQEHIATPSTSENMELSQEN